MTEPAASPLDRLRPPLMLLGVLTLVLGILGGLARIGWALPSALNDSAFAHGALMVCGFLGTLIALERAVALGKGWAYAGPAASVAGSILMLAGIPGPVPPLLLVVAAVLLLTMMLVVFRAQPLAFNAVIAAGAALWLVGDLLLLAGAPFYRVALPWVAFLVLTIGGERLDLSRILGLPAWTKAGIAAGVLTVTAGGALVMVDQATAVRLSGAGLLVLALLLSARDIARKNLRIPGLPRFVAVALYAGYFWLAFAGALALALAPLPGGLLWDALLHAVFLGFVFSMVFGHAPMILPAVLGVPVPMSLRFYAHLVLLHLSLAMRVAADALVLYEARTWAGLLNGVALILFFANTMGSAVTASRRREGSAAA